MGHIRWVQDECKLIRDAAGQPLEILGHWVDISERKLAEQVRQSSQANFHKLISLSPVAVGITTLDGIEYVNEQFTRLFGYTLADCSDIERWWQRAYPDPSYREQVTQTWLEAIATDHATGENIIPQEWQITCKDGSTKQIEFSHALIGDKGIMICHDIT